MLQPEDEPDVPRALRLLGDYRARRLELRVPSLWRYETGNILGLKYPELAAEAMEALLAVGIAEEFLDRDYCLTVLQFMRELGADAGHGMLGKDRRKPLPLCVAALIQNLTGFG